MTEDDSPPSDEGFALLDRLLDELMVKHLEMASLVGEYRDLIEEARERPWDRERRDLVRNLPGARYHVSATFTREQALRIEGELRKLFGD